jgi:leucyl-tRNA synthetase
MKDIAPMVPKVIKQLTKVSGDRKANMIKIGEVNEKETIVGAVSFYKDRFNAEIQVYSESDAERFDPKGRAVMALPYQPAIYIE